MYNKLANLITKLSKQYGSPKFEPHVTLLANISGAEKDIIFKTSQLAILINSFKIRLTKVEYRNEYFKCLFIKVEETKDIINANLKAREIFNREWDSEYIPHLSLMYGDFLPEIKEKIIKEIGKKFDIIFAVNSIHLFTAEGRPEDWQRIKEFILK
ncbi:MAG: 2'-5' RNA ligase family protein [Patescibacteria group bacterium]|nr:2'-5' RNA ligase family protein [Patescibacteria group bacterium]